MTPLQSIIVMLANECEKHLVEADEWMFDSPRKEAFCRRRAERQSEQAFYWATNQQQEARANDH